MTDAHLTLLDACSIINVVASRHQSDILAHDGPYALCDIVSREALYVRRGGDGEDSRDPEPIDVGSLIAQDLLTVITSTDDDELSMFIDLAQELDDGEAMTAAIAIHRGMTVVSDDKKATRVLGTAGVTVTSSLHLVKAWVEADKISADGLRRVLTDIRERGSYLPPRSHPLHAWWSGAI